MLNEHLSAAEGHMLSFRYILNAGVSGCDMLRPELHEFRCLYHSCEGGSPHTVGPYVCADKPGPPIVCGIDIVTLAGSCYGRSFGFVAVSAVHSAVAGVGGGVLGAAVELGSGSSEAVAAD